MKKILTLILGSFLFLGCYEDYRTEVTHDCGRPHIYVPAHPSVVTPTEPNGSSLTGTCQGLNLGDPRIPEGLSSAPECFNNLYIMCPNNLETWTEEFLTEEHCLYTAQIPGPNLGSFVCCQSEQPQ